MKMKLFTLIALMVLGTVSMASATETATKANAADLLAKVVKEKINFPKFLKSEGIKKTAVLVEFTLNDNGQVEVLNTCNCDERIKDYIIAQIEEIRLNDINHEAGDKYLLRLNFELI